MPQLMLRHTFQHLRGVTAKREQDLWRRGILDWASWRSTYRPQRSLFGEGETDNPVERELREFEQALHAGDAAVFGRALDRREHYRVCLSFPHETLFLDIETTGLSRYYDHITVVGWSLGTRYGFFVKGQEDAAFREALASAKTVVTFNGTLFDLPFIQQEFPNYRLPSVHVDLRFLARRVGLTGGQKEIERRLGLARHADVEGIAGESAPILWSEYTRGDLHALRLLLEYNAADIRGMKYIFDVATRELLTRLGFPLERVEPTPMAQIEPADPGSHVDDLITKCLIPWPAKDDRTIRLEDLVLVDRSPRLKVVGIDLTGSEARPTGWCVLDGLEVITDTLGGDDEIIARTVKEHPHVVSIDSPLSLPDGRVSVEDSDPGRAEFGIMRYSERVLKKRGVNVYPALIPSMQRLTARGIRLAQQFRSLGFPVIESYPGAAQDIMGIPRKRKSLEFLEQGLAAFGVSGSFIKTPVTHDELDAITSAVVGAFFWAGQVERLGPDPIGEEALMIPDLRVDAGHVRDRLVIGLSGALGAGKTTAAHYLESRGCTYCRYSQVIARLVKAVKGEYERKDLQVEGERVHRELGQRWLGRELIRPLLATKFIVIDGLRYPDDHAFLTEIFGAQFLHIHLVARRATRKERFEHREHADFEVADRHPVESRAGELKVFARDVVENNHSIANLHRAMDKILQRNWR